MKKVRLLVFCMIMFSMLGRGLAHAYEFGDYSSSTLSTKAWEALKKEDLDAVMAYTNKNIELYSKQAKQMQQNLQAYVQGDDKQIFSQWALNDIATSYFIQGEALRKAGKLDEAKAAFKKIIDEYSYGQTWDTRGWFWKPAEAAKEKIAMIESGSTLDFGDYSSAFLTTQAWKALEKKDVPAVTIYVNKVLELYEPKAQTMQETLAANKTPLETKDEIFSYWALNDVGTALYIKGEAMRQEGKYKEAKEAYEKLVNNYYLAQCWDPKGWFWKPADAAQQVLDNLDTGDTKVN